MVLDTMSSENSKTRIRILEAARYLLEESQGKGVRMGDMAKKAGISRQALYLHFKTRAELLIATTRYVDEVNRVEERLVPSRTAKTGIERLNAYVEGWGGYIPEVYGILKALLALRDTDDAAAEAWDERMQAMRHGCQAAVDALKRDNVLAPSLDTTQATDVLWTLLSVRNWEQWTIECEWSQKRYIETVKLMAHQVLVAGGP